MTSDRNELLAAIEHQRSVVEEWELAVRDTRRALDRAVAALHEAVFERDRTASHLNHLRGWLDAPEFQ